MGKKQKIISMKTEPMVIKLDNFIKQEEENFRLLIENPENLVEDSDNNDIPSPVHSSSASLLTPSSLDKEPEQVESNKNFKKKRLDISDKQNKIKETIRTGSMMILAFLALGYMLVYLRFVLVPLVLAKFFHYLLMPLAHYLKKRRFPHWLSVSISLLLGLAIMTILSVIVIISVKQLAEQSDMYQRRAKELLNKIFDWADQQGFENSRNTVMEKMAEVPIDELILSLVNFVVQISSQALLMILFLIYMLYESDSDGKKSPLRIRVDQQIRHYIGVKVIISLITGSYVSFVLFFLHVDLSLVFGLLTFFLNFVPNVGSLIAVLLPLPIVILDPNQTWMTCLLVLLIPLFGQIIIGNFIEPKVLGKTMDLHPITVIVALVFWGALWGIVGTILSVPIVAVTKLWLIHLDHPICQFLGRLFEGSITLGSKKAK